VIATAIDAIPSTIASLLKEYRRITSIFYNQAERIKFYRLVDT